MNTKRSSSNRARALFLLATVTLTYPAQATDFRGFDWGASKKAVRATEKLPIHHDLPDEIAYWNFEVAGFSAGLVYRFEGGKLVKAHYLSRNTTPDAEEDYQNYLDFQRHFDNEIGPHLEEVWIWADGAKHEAAEQTVAAITSGQVTPITRWAYPGTTVRMELVGKDGTMESLRVYFEPAE